MSLESKNLTLGYKDNIILKDINVTIPNGKITIDNSGDELYYQGIMKSNTEMPWNIKVKYKLDGKEYKAQDLAGKSGKLEITISIKKNEWE